MSSASPESREVPVDVLPPLPEDARVSTANPSKVEVVPPFPGFKGFYHPASGVAILGIDFAVFGTELFSGFLDTPVMCVLAFLATFPIVFLVQWKWSKNHFGSAFGKAFLGAFLAGLPFSIAGTMLGAAVIALSGLPHHPVDALKRIFSPTQKLTE